jgi:hypothetical protein
MRETIQQGRQVMPTRVRLESRRRSDPAAFQGELEETVILRNEDVVAVLPQGDGLRYLVRLSLEQLRLLERKLGGISEERPRLKEVLQALIEYKEEERRERGESS